MKSKKILIYLLLLILVGAGLAWQFYFKKKPGSKTPQKISHPAANSLAKQPAKKDAQNKVEKTQPQEDLKVSAKSGKTNESNQPTTESREQAPSKTGSNSDIPKEETTKELPSPSEPDPQTTKQKPTIKTTEPSIPQAQETSPNVPETPASKNQPPSSQAQSLLQIQSLAPIEIAEGSSFFVEGLSVSGAGDKTLRYTWRLKEGPQDKIILEDIQGPRPLVRLQPVEQPTTFDLELTVSDGQATGVQSFTIKAFPARLQKAAAGGGAFVKVRNLGMQWVTLRGSQLEVYSDGLKPSGQLPLDFTAAKIFTTTATQSRATYLRDPQNHWWLAEQNAEDPTQFDRRRLPMLGNKIRDLLPLNFQNEPYGLALLENSVELWNFSDSRKPKLKSSVRLQISNPNQVAFNGNHLFITNEETLASVELSTSRMIASIPIGGSVTSLKSIAVGKKNFLIATLGQDRTPQNRQDYGLKIFEILEGGRLGPEKRISVMDGASVEAAQVIPKSPQVLLSIFKEDRFQLMIWDLAQQKPVSLKVQKDTPLLAPRQFVLQLREDILELVVADGTRLREFTLKKMEDSAAYEATERSHVSGIMDALWAELDPQGKTLWVGDEGTVLGGAVAKLNPQSLKVNSDWNHPGLFPLSTVFIRDPQQSPKPLKEKAKDSSDTNQPKGKVKTDVAKTQKSSQSKIAKTSHTPQGAMVLLAPSAPPEQLLAKSLSALAWIDPIAEKPMIMSQPFLGGGVAASAGKAFGIAMQYDNKGMLVAVAMTKPKGGLKDQAGTAGVALLRKAAAQKISAFLQSDLLSKMEWIPLPEARDVALSLDGKAAFVASGIEGVVVLDLQEKQASQRMSLGSNDWVADRLLLSHNGQLLLASFIQTSTRQVIVKTFGVDENYQLQEYSTLTGLMAIETAEGYRAPGLSLTQDDLYLLAPLSSNLLSVFNFSNPGDPVLITQGKAGGAIRYISISPNFSDIFLALGPVGVERWEFSF